MVKFSLLLICFYCLLFPASLQAQQKLVGKKTERQAIVIDSIIIEGNKRTSEQLIRKLIELDQGDSIYFDRLFLSMKSSRFHLIRTRLFQEVTILLKDLKDDHANIYIQLEEKNLVSLLGTVELADRNISEWWLQHKLSLRRLTVGGGAAISNWTGLGEQTGLYGLIGLNQGIKFYFTIPYFTARSAWGGSVNVDWLRKRIFGVENEENVLQYLEVSDFGLHKLHTDVGISYRPTPEIVSKFKIGYNQLRINEKVQDTNPSFFGGHGSRLSYVSMALSFEINKTDHFSYPLNGTSFFIKAQRNGLQVIDQVRQELIRIDINHYQQWRRKLYSAHRITGRISRGELDNFYLQRAFGYEDDFVRSYELSVIQGQHFFITRNDLKYQLLSFDYIPPKYVQWLYDEVPFDLFVKFILDGGFVINDNPVADNQLANELLMGYGLGFDFLFLNEYAASINFSINLKNQKGIYLHLNW